MKLSEFLVSFTEYVKAVEAYHSVKPASEWGARWTADSVNDAEPSYELVRKASTIRAAENFNRDFLAPHRKEWGAKIREILSSVGGAGSANPIFNLDPDKAEGPVEHAEKCWRSFAGLEVLYVSPDLSNVHPTNTQYRPWAGRWTRSRIENLQQDGTWWPAAPADALRTNYPNGEQRVAVWPAFDEEDVEITSFYAPNANRVYNRVRFAAAPRDMTWAELRVIYCALTGVEPEHIHVPDGHRGVAHGYFSDPYHHNHPMWAYTSDEDQPHDQNAVAVAAGDWVAIDG